MSSVKKCGITCGSTGMLGLISPSPVPKMWGREKTQSQISKAPRLLSSSGPVSKLSLASFSAGKGPSTYRVHSQCRWSVRLGKKPSHPGVCQRPVTGLLTQCSIVGLRLESFNVVRMRRWEERAPSLLALWSASISVPVIWDLAVSSRGSLCVPQVLFILQFVLQSLGWLEYTWRSCFSARNLRQCCGEYLVALSLAGRSIFSFSSSPAWQTAPALPSLLHCLQCCETTCAGICGSVMGVAADVVSKWI